MSKQIIFVVLIIAFLPALALADAADDDYWDDDYDDDDDYDCADLCERATQLCNAPCAPSAYNECITFCEENLSQFEIDCAQNYNCSNFNACLCDVDDDSDDDGSATDDDSQADDDAQPDDDADNIGDDDQQSDDDESDGGGDSGDDDDDDNGLFCSISSGERSTALTLFMLAIGMVAFIISLRPKRAPR